MCKHMLQTEIPDKCFTDATRLSLRSEAADERAKMGALQMQKMWGHGVTAKTEK